MSHRGAKTGALADMTCIAAYRGYEWKNVSMVSKMLV